MVAPTHSCSLCFNPQLFIMACRILRHAQVSSVDTTIPGELLHSSEEPSVEEAGSEPTWKVAEEQGPVLSGIERPRAWGEGSGPQQDIPRLGEQHVFGLVQRLGRKWSELLPVPVIHHKLYSHIHPMCGILASGACTLTKP